MPLQQLYHTWSCCCACCSLDMKVSVSCPDIVAKCMLGMSWFFVLLLRLLLHLRSLVLQAEQSMLAAVDFRLLLLQLVLLSIVKLIGCVAS